MRRRTRKPGEHHHDQEAAGHAQPGHRVGVGLGELIIGPGSVSGAASKTSSGEMLRMLASISAPRLYVVRGGGAAQHAACDVAVGTVARRVGGAEDRDAGFAERGGQVQRTAIHADHGGGAPRGVDQAGQARVVWNATSAARSRRRTVEHQRDAEFVAQPRRQRAVVRHRPLLGAPSGQRRGQHEIARAAGRLRAVRAAAGNVAQPAGRRAAPRPRVPDSGPPRARTRLSVLLE